nr:RluA family pseudouridine synthase [Bacillus pinisoli]
MKDKEISKTALTDIKFNGGHILVNHVPITVRYELKKGDILHVVFPPEVPSTDMVKENIPLNIPYEDDYLLIINKQPYMSTIPSREHPNGSLANALLYYYEQQQIGSTVHIVNRLDRDTSGLLIVAKHRYTHHLFSKQQKSSSIKRTYEALVHGVMSENKGTIKAPIGRKDTSIIEREVREDGQEAITHFHVIQHYKEFTHVSVSLETGRTHQIRVHMAHIGHPLLGDDLYGGKRDFITRQALHSRTLSFHHPITHEKILITSDLPNDMKKVLEERA